VVESILSVICGLLWLAWLKVRKSVTSYTRCVSVESPMPAQPEDRRDFDPRSSCYALYVDKMRRYRARESYTQDEVGAACNVSGKLIAAIENMRRMPNLDISQKLDSLYSVDFFEDQYYEVLREGKLTSGFRTYAEQEEQAALLEMHAPQMIPGLFQVESYARHVLRAGQSEETLDQMVAVRIGRQEILDGDDPTFVVALIKESVLREPVGGRDVMREQLAHLVALARRRNVSVQVIPYGAPVYVSGAFVLLGYTEGASLGYVEAAIGQGHLVEPPAVVHRMAVRFSQIRAEALPVSESEQLIISIREAL
jgi:DNA-binding XRE family transcriptional regulator